MISILVPFFNESNSLPELYGRLNDVTSQLPSYNFEYVFVDDGSRDNSLSILFELAKKDNKITVIELSRNFGKEIAVTAGMDNLNCDAVIVMDADLQHPPELIPIFIEKWEEGYEIVATKRSGFEKRSALKKISSHAFYRLMNVISDLDMVSQTTDFRLLDRKVIRLFNSFTERNRMVRGIVDWMGFKKTYIEFEAPQRFAGKSVYSYRKLINLAINSITSFSLFPLKVAGYLGLTISLLSAFGLIIMVTDKVFCNLGGFTTLAYFMILNTFMIGVVLSCLGLIALYIGHIHAEVINRPLYIVRDIHGRRAAAKI